jgi:hypothetical protein
LIGRREAAVAAFFLITALLLSTLDVRMVLAETSDLQLKVVDHNGNPIGNVEVILTNSTFRRAFRTTSAGIATFRGLSPGEYNVQVTIDNVPVANETVRVPHEGERVVRLAVAELKARVLDAEGTGVKGVTVQITSSTGKVTRSATTSEDGTVSFSNLPLSTLRDVGTYTVTVKVMNATVLETSVNHAPLNGTLDLVAPLVKLRFELLDMQGEPVSEVELRLSADGVLFTLNVAKGEAAIRGVPTSQVVGPYNLTVVKAYAGTRVTVLTDSLTVFEPSNRTLILNVADADVLVLADGSDPVKGAFVEVRSSSGSRIARGSTDDSGRVRFQDLPLSTLPGVGELEFRVILGGRALLNETVHVVGPVSGLRLELPRREVAITLLKPDGSPLPEAAVEVTEPGTDRKISVASGNDGTVRFAVLPVPSQLKVVYRGVTVQTEKIDFSSPPSTLQVRGVSIPVTLTYKDWTGSQLRGIRVRAWQNNEPLPVQVTDGEASFVVPVRGTVIVEAVLGGQVIERRELQIDGPTVLTIYVRGVQVGESVIGPEVVGTAGAVAVAAVLIALGVLVYIRTVRATLRSQ